MRYVLEGVAWVAIVALSVACSRLPVRAEANQEYLFYAVPQQPELVHVINVPVLLQAQSVWDQPAKWQDYKKNFVAIVADRDILQLVGDKLLRRGYVSATYASSPPQLIIDAKTLDIDIDHYILHYDVFGGGPTPVIKLVLDAKITNTHGQALSMKTYSCYASEEYYHTSTEKTDNENFSRTLYKAMAQCFTQVMIDVAWFSK